jgi:peptidoglycan-associated lipoprotein
MMFQSQSYALLRRLVLTSMIAGAVAAAGCSKAQKPDEGAVPNAVQADENASGDSDSGRAMGLQTVYFGYDAFTLNGEAKATAKANADILKANESVKVQVEGHCDQRGGIQYNIALGEKRANATRKFLIDQGVAEDRITTISFGKERPLDPGTSEDAYGKNRRANFVITSK